MSSYDAIKMRLKNNARLNNISMQEALNAYGIEKTLHRLANSKYRDCFILKGGVLLYAMSKGNYPRATVDIDFLAISIPNEEPTIRQIFLEIFSTQNQDDLLRYDLSTFQMHSITPFKDYPGFNISIVAFLDRTRIRISIDIGFGDIYYPELQQVSFPSILGNAEPVVLGYPIYSVIAEKLEATISNGYQNSRYKDFYDMYVLSSLYDFDGLILFDAIKLTFDRHHITMSIPIIFQEEYINDPTISMRWNSFLKIKMVKRKLTLKETITQINIFLGPIIDAILTKKSFKLFWSHTTKLWIEYENAPS